MTFKEILCGCEIVFQLLMMGVLLAMMIVMIANVFIEFIIISLCILSVEAVIDNWNGTVTEGDINKKK